MGIVLALMAAFFFGLGNVYASRGNFLDGINTHEGLLLTLIVNNLVNILLIPLIFLFTDLPAFNWVGIFSFVGAGFFTSFLGRILLFSGILIIGASRAGSFKITAPLFTVLIAVFILKEKIATIHFLGIFIILMGVVIVVRETQDKLKVVDALDIDSNEKPEQSNDAGNNIQENKEKKAGIIIALLAGLSFGTGNVLRKVGVLYYPNPLVGGVINSFASLIFLISVIYFNPVRSFMPIVVNFKNLARRKGSKEYMLSGFSTSCAIYSIYFSLSLLEVSIVNTIASIEALFTILIAAILLKNKEIISTTLIIGALIIIGGIGVIMLF